MYVCMYIVYNSCVLYLVIIKTFGVPTYLNSKILIINLWIVIKRTQENMDKVERRKE